MEEETVSISFELERWDYSEIHVTNIGLHQVSVPMKIRQLKSKLVGDVSQGEPELHPEDSSFSSGVIILPGRACLRRWVFLNYVRAVLKYSL